jgi:hypothetical protein
VTAEKGQQAPSAAQRPVENERGGSSVKRAFGQWEGTAWGSPCNKTIAALSAPATLGMTQE